MGRREVSERLRSLGKFGPCICRLPSQCIVHPPSVSYQIKNQEFIEHGKRRRKSSFREKEINECIITMI